ncbi:unnamed protein product [Brassica rapa subsp. trilocularis]
MQLLSFLGCLRSFVFEIVFCSSFVVYCILSILFVFAQLCRCFSMFAPLLCNLLQFFF